MRILETHFLLRIASAMLAVCALAVAIGHAKLLLPGLLCLAALLFAAACIDRMEAGDYPAAERDWGGLGMEPSGWRLSPSLAYLLAAAFFGALSVVGLGIVVYAERGPPFVGSKGGTSTERPVPERSAFSGSEMREEPGPGPGPGAGPMPRPYPIPSSR